MTRMKAKKSNISPRISFRISRFQHTRLARLAERTDTTVGALVKECVASHLPVMEKAQKEAA